MISIIIPAYNEAHIINDTVQFFSPFGDEVVVVDDSRTDNTSVLATNAGGHVVRIEKNLGYVSAIKPDLAIARGDIIVTDDADGEYPTDKITLLVSTIQQNKADLVQAWRKIILWLSEKSLNILANRIEWIGDIETGFRAIRSNIARKLRTDAACICGVFCLDAVTAYRRLVEILIRLNLINKHRNIAWFHLKQLFYIYCPGIYIRSKNQNP